MDRIPEDVMRAAREAAAYWSAYETFYFEKLVGDFARAILNERNRCALIAEGKTIRHPIFVKRGATEFGTTIANLIRTPDTQE